MIPSGRLNQKNFLQFFIKGGRIFILIVYVLSVVGVPTLAVHAGAAEQREDIQLKNDRINGYYYYLPLVMGGSGTEPILVVDIDHEEGDLSGDWDGDNLGGYVGVSAAAALAGTDYGLWSDTAQGTSQYAYINFNETTTRIRFRFYLDVSNLTPDTAGYLHIIGIKTPGETDQLAYVRLRYTGSAYLIQFDIKQDDELLDHILYSSAGSITGEHYVECEIIAGAGTGEAYLWVDGTLHNSATDIDNDTIFTSVGFFEAGNWARSGTWSGELYIDEIIMNNTGDEIGPLGQ